MTETSEDRQTSLEEMAALAAQLVGEETPVLLAAQWKRLLLGKLTELLLSDDGRLTGAELRHLLGMAEAAPEPKPAASGAGLPPQFSKLVRQIYGVNLQTDIRPPKSADDRRDIRENPNLRNPVFGVYYMQNASFPSGKHQVRTGAWCFLCAPGMTWILEAGALCEP